MQTINDYVSFALTGPDLSGIRFMRDMRVTEIGIERAGSFYWAKLSKPVNAKSGDVFRLDRENMELVKIN